MARIAIVTDSNSGITQAEGKKLGVYVLPMPFDIDGQPYFEDINLTQEQFYEKLTGDVSLYKLLETEYGVFLEKYYKVLKVQKASKEMSRLLKCKVGDPMFDLFKLTFDKNGRAQIISVSILKGEDTYYVLSNEEGDEIKHSGMRWKF